MSHPETTHPPSESTPIRTSLSNDSFSIQISAKRYELEKSMPVEYKPKGFRSSFNQADCLEEKSLNKSQSRVLTDVDISSHTISRQKPKNCQSHTFSSLSKQRNLEQGKYL